MINTALSEIFFAVMVRPALKKICPVPRPADRDGIHSWCSPGFSRARFFTHPDAGTGKGGTDMYLQKKYGVRVVRQTQTMKKVMAGSAYQGSLYRFALLTCP